MLEIDSEKSLIPVLVAILFMQIKKTVKRNQDIFFIRNEDDSITIYRRRRIYTMLSVQQKKSANYQSKTYIHLRLQQNRLQSTIRSIPTS